LHLGRLMVGGPPQGESRCREQARRIRSRRRPREMGVVRGRLRIAAGSRDRMLDPEAIEAEWAPRRPSQCLSLKFPPWTESGPLVSVTPTMRCAVSVKTRFRATSLEAILKDPEIL
jgi:hypothetical protein